MYRILTVRLADGVELRCFSPAELAIHEGDQCVVEHDRVHEFGCVVSLEPHEDASAAPRQGMATALRRATLQDQAKAKENAVVGHMALKTVLKKIEDQRLPIRVIQLRYSFDRAVLCLTYTAEERMECRELIKALIGELHVRVELKQIGVRDAARLVGGVAACGRKLCCCSWLEDFAVVSVKMAKTQRLSLNPGTIGGMCTRLKCCLRYEHDVYKGLAERMPRDGVQVKCPDGLGRVLDKDVLGQRVRVRMEDGRMLTLAASQVMALGEDRLEPGAAAVENGDEDTDSERP